MNARGPGLAKVRHVPTHRVRALRLVAAAEWHVREWLESADVVSEGAGDDDGRYYGTTSIVIARSRLPEHEELAEALLPKSAKVNGTKNGTAKKSKGGASKASSARA